MSDVMTREVAELVLSKARELINARIFEGSTQRPFQVQKMVIDLTTATLSTRPLKIGFPFRSLYVQDATDVLVNIDMQIGTQDSLQSPFTIKRNDVWTHEFAVSEAYLSWSAQSGKTITLVFFTDSEFRSGSQISVTGGGVSIVDGSTSSTSRVDLTAATATSVLTANSSRKVATIQNKTGADVWFGGSSVSSTGANLGLKVVAGGSLVFRNTGTLYAYSVLGGTGDNGLLIFEEA